MHATLRLTTLLFCGLLLAHPAARAEAPPRTPDFPRTELFLGMYRIQAEVAATAPARQHGLMYRKSLPPNAGMLFVFPLAQQHCFWMKNTPLPLSIAFIDDTGRIVNIADMQPQTETSHCAARPVRYALEMNQGWFRDKGFKPGAKVEGLPR